MQYNTDFKNYSKEISSLLECLKYDLLKKSIDLIYKIKRNNKKIFIVGNGGSSSIASHVSLDFTKIANVTSTNFNNSNLITCFANDYGHDNWIKEAIKAYAISGDLIILISSSGVSKNIINAAKFCKKNNFKILTFSGFSKNNPLSKLGNINFHVKSNDYNHIEITHHIILNFLVEKISKK